jgi:hypothetical protein
MELDKGEAQRSVVWLGAPGHWAIHRCTGARAHGFADVGTVEVLVLASRALYHPCYPCQPASLAPWPEQSLRDHQHLRRQPHFSHTSRLLYSFLHGFSTLCVPAVLRGPQHTRPAPRTLLLWSDRSFHAANARSINSPSAESGGGFPFPCPSGFVFLFGPPCSQRLGTIQFQGKPRKAATSEF